MYLSVLACLSEYTDRWDLQFNTGAERQIGKALVGIVLSKFYLDGYVVSQDQTGDFQHSSPTLEPLRYDDHK